ncbi:hypothetical protein JJC00_06510 [Bradyrhizobium diazoefficiens]|uniref:hypothetical protein n=1 Tax=Bradyrhizobium diazoefficiens TaxID=1355477 RepID=UPI00190E0D5C|nr:hypothetical protein [Bradyrhizobium diazoefficiens]QQO35331.1 hypothetical protein JJC00_06510 [Bradyrhizobium diazoefficiens]
MPGGVYFLVFFFAIFAASQANAQSQSIDAQAKALDLITKTADSVCGIVKTAGNSESMKVKGEVKAQLSGLIRQLADLGISGDADFNSDKYEGFIRTDLATAIQNSAQCKFNVFDKLQAKMIKSG